MSDSQPPKVIDYEGSTYRTDFWEGRGRDYEDRVERIALRRLLAANGGRRLLEIGAGFGRLTNEYRGYDEVVLMDYSFSHMRDARQHLSDPARGGSLERYRFVAADAYHLPFRPGAFDAATMIRVIHHIADVPSVMVQIRRVLTPGATFILEHANKRNLKAMLRYALKRQSWSPYTLEPVEFVELNFDFHPAYIVKELDSAGFTIRRRLPVSFFRLPLLKNAVPTRLLAGLDGVLQHTGAMVTPSVFIAAQNGGSQSQLDVEGDDLFVCPACGGDLVREGDVMICQQDSNRYAVTDGVYDFRNPLT